ncbi:MAG TPA: DUF4136 domain-containing protein [Thermoanaerobaculia bacterium]|nr:DUF4136 domain-containing protein [Thermoanaerobaculia bacterium]
MRTPFGTLVLAAAVVSAVGHASSITVESKADPAADFSRYKSYSWTEMKEVRSEAVKKRIMSAVDAQLQRKGFVRTDGGGDLKVAVHPSLSKEYPTNSYDPGWEYGWGTWAPPFGDIGTGSALGASIPIGTVMVDLVDASTKKLVWRGAARSPLDSEASAEKRQELVDDAMKKLFKTFPSKKK